MFELEAVFQSWAPQVHIGSRIALLATAIVEHDIPEGARTDRRGLLASLE